MNSDDMDVFIADMMDEGKIEPRVVGDELQMHAVPDEDNPIWQDHLREIEETVAKFIELGLLEVSGVDEDGNPTYELTEEGQRILDQES